MHVLYTNVRYCRQIGPTKDCQGANEDASVQIARGMPAVLLSGKSEAEGCPCTVPRATIQQKQARRIEPMMCCCGFAARGPLPAMPLRTALTEMLGIEHPIIQGGVAIKTTQHACVCVCVWVSEFAKHWLCKWQSCLEGF